MTNIRTVMGSMDLDELLSNRDQINARLLQVVDAATEAWGVKVTRIEIKDIAPPRDLVDSMARQMKAEREKRAQILEAEGLRQAAILKAEGEKQAVVLAAEGRKEAAFRDAEARERFAQAEAKATEMVSEAIAKGNVQAINYFVANNYVKALEAIAKSPNQKVLMMPLEASAVIGSLAGLAEITSEAFGQERRRGRIRRRRRPRRAPGQRAARLSSAAARGGRTPCKAWSPIFYGFGAWNWLILAVLLFILEAVVPGVHFLWFGIAAVIVGALAMATGMAWPFQIIAFARDLGADRVLGAPLRAPRRGHERPARSQRPRPAVHRPLAGGRAGDPERPRQGARRRHAVAGRGPGCARRRARHGHVDQGQRAGGGACSDMTATPAHLRGSSPS